MCIRDRDEGTTVVPEETPTAAEESSSEAPSESETDSATEAEQTLSLIHIS